jgi:uncharacterized protein
MNKHNTINYIELPAKDLDAIKNFYTKAFGWKFTDYGPDYTAFNDGVMDGGFTKGSVSGDTGPLVILYSENLEESLDTIKSCGATITKDIFEFPGGRRLQFLDPAGNELAIWTDK